MQVNRKGFKKLYIHAQIIHAYTHYIIIQATEVQGWEQGKYMVPDIFGTDVWSRGVLM